jgi:hypothetical protein
MIGQRNVYGYIGGSDANRLYGSFETKTFKDFWNERLTGIKLNEFNTNDTAVGNIMEHRVMDELGIDPAYRDIFVKKEGTIAGINTDALTPDAYDEIKTALPKLPYKWLNGRAISVNYRRQLMHGLYVTGRILGRLHVLPMTEQEKKNPFGLNIKGRVVTFEFEVKDFNMEEHHRRIMYLTKCFSEKIQPTDGGLKKYRV